MIYLKKSCFAYIYISCLYYLSYYYCYLKSIDALPLTVIDNNCSELLRLVVGLNTAVALNVNLVDNLSP